MNSNQVTSLVLAVLSFSLSGCAHFKETPQAEFAFGAIADCQYCADPGSGKRKYSLSQDKLAECVAHLNSMDLNYVIHLGDFIDRDFESFNVVGPIYDRLKMPSYHVLGNHDFSVADEHKETVPETMGLPSKYYDFEVDGWRHVVLDGNDISFHAYPENSEQYKEAREYYKANQIQSPEWNGAIGPEQRAWLREVLTKATQNGEKVILYCHFPIFPNDVHNLWNAEEIVALIESYSCVKAYINGHNHSGNYGFKNGVHYLTLKGMVDTEETSYAVINVDDKRIQITGFGRQEDRTLLVTEGANL